MEHILNFDLQTPYNVALLDNVVDQMYRGNQKEIQEAQQILTAFQQHPDAWTRVSQILEQSSNSNTKYIALQVLHETIRYKWNILPEQQRQGIKNYIVKTVIDVSQDARTLQTERVLVGKMNEVLVQIVKKEWPQTWRSFIPEIVAASKASESVCENNMNILQLLSEEIFDFSSGKLTQKKAREMSQTFTEDFAQIYGLCEYILAQASKPSLILATLNTLQRFLTWIPPGYIFQTNLIEALVTKFFPVRDFRNATLRCLVEIVGITDLTPEYSAKMEQLFFHLMRLLSGMLPIQTDIAAIYENADDYDQKFIQILGLLFTTLFKNHLLQLEKNSQLMEPVILGHRYLVNISKCDEPELFKTCLEYWHHLAENLYFEEKNAATPKASFGQGGAVVPMFLADTAASVRKATYEREIMPDVRLVMISKMAKPEEVIIVEDENGDIIKERMKDVDSIQLYKTMRDTLIYLTHLNYSNTERIMLDKLAKQIDGTEWSWNNLNTLCWAIGSISGAMRVKEEKRFLVTVIRDLLGLVEQKRGKDNKAVVASNIMYIVGQYPRFLEAHWKFLRTVINKLFEFMHETFEGVQEMSCETFLKISKDTKKMFVVPQDGERPFIEDILQNLQEHISDLSQQHIHIFYEAVGHMISVAPTENSYREHLLAGLMKLPNSTWGTIMWSANQNPDILKDSETMRQLVNLLKTNVSAATSVGPVFVHQMKMIFHDMFGVYKAYSQLISQEVAAHGTIATKYSHVRMMRSVKKETLKLVETFIVNSNDSANIRQNFAGPLLEATLGDYKTSVPDAKDPGVLTLLAVLLDKLRYDLQTPPSGTEMDIPKVILENVLECTLPMITKNFEDYPEHRMNLFTLLRSINANCFHAFFRIPPQGFKLVLDSILWAVRHNDYKIYQTGLHILKEMMDNIGQIGDARLIHEFYKSFYIRLMSDIMYVLTDTMHKAGFELQATILFGLFLIVRERRITEPIFDTAQHPGVQSNEEFVTQYMNKLIGDSFPNLSKQQVASFVAGMFDLTRDFEQFKQHLRDFLVIQREFSDQDNDELYKAEADKQERERQARLASVPGLVSSPQQQQQQ